MDDNTGTSGTVHLDRDTNGHAHNHADANRHPDRCAAADRHAHSHAEANRHTHGHADPNADGHTDPYTDPDPHDAAALAKPDGHVHAHPAYKHVGAPATTDETTAAPNQSYTNSQELRRPFSVTKRMLDER
jgi:hypothetical protein